MPRSLCWKDEYTEYMHEICPGRLTPEVTKLLNEKFGTNYNKTQIGGVRKRLGLLVSEAYQGKLLTKEQHDYLVSIQKNKISRDVANEMNQKFGLSLTEKQIRNYRRNNNLHSGLTGKFEKGQVPYNKGKKFPNRPPNSGYFKKGNRPPNYVPVGTINYTTDGYPKEKIGEPNQWVLKHRKVWEEHHGPIPKGYSIVFLDGDKTNYGISNLACLSKNEIARMNQNHLFTSDADLTKSGIGLTKLTNKIREVEKMASLYELTGIFKQINDMEGLDEETKADTLDSIDWTDQFEEKVENTVKVIKNKEADKKQLKEEIDRLTARCKSIDNDITRLKTGLQGAFEITGHDKVKGLLFTVYLAKNQPSVIVDEDLLPKKYFVIAKKPDKNAIKELLNAGKKVKGATLQESRSLRIK